MDCFSQLGAGSVNDGLFIHERAALGIEVEWFAVDISRRLPPFVEQAGSRGEVPD